MKNEAASDEVKLGLALTAFEDLENDNELVMVLLGIACPELVDVEKLMRDDGKELVDLMDNLFHEKENDGNTFDSFRAELANLNKVTHFLSSSSPPLLLIPFACLFPPLLLFLLTSSSPHSLCLPSSSSPSIFFIS